MVMQVPTRLPKGLVDRPANDRFNLLGILDPTKWITYFDDFAGPVDSLPSATDVNYTLTKTGTGTIAQANGLGGLTLLTNSGAQNDALFFQKKGEAFLWNANKKLFFGARWKVDDATNAAAVMGLQVTDTTPLAVSDGIFFVKAGGAAALSAVVEKASASQTLACGNMADDTFMEMAIVYPGQQTNLGAGNTAVYRFYVYINGVLQGYVDATTQAPDTQTLCVSFGVLNNTAAARSMTIDWIFAALER